jgi:hypothetical protein
LAWLRDSAAKTLTLIEVDSKIARTVTQEISLCKIFRILIAPFFLVHIPIPLRRRKIPGVGLHRANLPEFSHGINLGLLLYLGYETEKTNLPWRMNAEGATKAALASDQL